MKIFSTFVQVIFFSLLILISCTPLKDVVILTLTPTTISSPPVDATATPTPFPTFTYTPTATFTQTPTFTFTPTFTPSPTLFALEGTLLPTSFSQITRANANLVSAIVQWQGKPVADIDFIPGTLELAVASANSIEIYELANRQVIRKLYPHSGEIVDIAFNPDKTWLVAGSRRGTEKYGYSSSLEVWHGPDWKPLGVLYGTSGGITGLTFSPDSHKLVVAYTDLETSQDGTVDIWKIPGWVISDTLKTGTLLEVAVSADGKLLATSPNRYQLQIWDFEKGDLLFKPSSSFTGAVSCLAFSPDRRTLATGHYDGTIRLWEANTGLLKQLIRSTGIIESLNFNPDGTVLASGSSYSTPMVRLWASDTGELLRELDGHQTSVDRVLFSPDGQLLVSSSYDGSIWLWGIRP